MISEKVTFDESQILIGLVGSVDGHVQGRLLLEAGQGQPVLGDQLTGLNKVHLFLRSTNKQSNYFNYLKNIQL